MMIVYCILISIILISGLAFTKSIHKNESLFFAIVSISLTFVMGFRGLSVGKDTLHYSRIYEFIAQNKLSDIIQYASFSTYIGYVILMKACSVIGGNYYFFQIIVAALFCGGIIKYIRENCEDKFLGLIVFVCSGLYLGAFNITREMFALMILLNCWTQIEKGKYKKGLILYVIAVSVHLSSFVFAYCFLARYLLRKWPRIIKIIPVGIILAVIFYERLIDIARQWLPAYSEYYKNYKTLQTAGGVRIIWAIVSLISIYLLYITKKEKKDKYTLSAVFSLVYVATNIIGLYFNYIERIGTYFSPFTITIYEGMADSFKRKDIKTLFKVGIVLSYVAYFILSCKSDQYKYCFFF